MFEHFKNKKLAQRGLPLVLLKELPRAMRRPRKRRKHCCLHHVLRRDFRQSPGQLEKLNYPHTEKAHVIFSDPKEKAFSTGC